MAKPDLIMALGKVIIAAAWVDGEISQEEINSLKDLLFRMPGMTAGDWAELEIYIESPVGEAERARLIGDLQAELRTAGDQALAMAALDDILHADGEVTAEERRIFEEIKSALEEVNVSIFGQLSRILSGPVARRSHVVEDAPNRERHLEDFVKNKIFYKLRQQMDEASHLASIPDDRLRKLSLAGGLMARVAYVDREIKAEEVSAMADVLQKGWSIPGDEAQLVAEVAVSEIANNMDYYRLSREFFERTTEDERVHFLDVLFSVAGGDGSVSYRETEEIRAIANLLKLTHRQFIHAKLKVPRDRRVRAPKP